MFFVSMTDPFMSEWGKSEGKINKLIFECDTKQEADAVMKHAIWRKDMEDISLHKEKPIFDESDYFVQVKTKDIYPTWYVI